MVNNLTITKIDNEYFSFILNGDLANEILNTRNDATMVGVNAHIKTSNGANLIKEQNIPFGNVTISDGVNPQVPTSPKDMMLKLRAIGYFDWIISGSAGSARFDQLLDTFNYFGNDGKTVRVSESQLKLIPVDFPNTEALDSFPFPLIANKWVKISSNGLTFEYVDLPNTGIGTYVKVPFNYLSDPSIYTLPAGAVPYLVLINNVPWSSWTYVGVQLTVSGYPLTSEGFTDQVVIYYQI